MPPRVCVDTGKGVQAIVQGRRVAVGNAKLMADACDGQAFPVLSDVTEWAAKGEGLRCHFASTWLQPVPPFFIAISFVQRSVRFLSMHPA